MRQEHPIIFKPLDLDPPMRTRLYLDIGPGYRCAARSCEAVLDARVDLEEYLAQVRNGDIANTEGAEQDEHQDQHDDNADDDLDGGAHGDEILDEIEGDTADDEDQE
jgi:hypothetical protein